MGEVFYEKGKKYNCVVRDTPYFRKTATINGKRHNFYGDGEKDCLSKIAKAKEETALGLVFDKSSTKMGEVFKYWLFDIKRVDADIKASTFARYESLYRLYIKDSGIARSVLSKLETVTMQAYITNLYEKEGKTGSTIKSIVKVLKMFFSWAQEEGYIIKNPCRNLALPGRQVRTEEKVEIFSEQERLQIFKYMEEHKYQYDTLILLAFATGMRQGELLSLKWADIHSDRIDIKRSTAMVTHIDREGNRDRYREVWDTKTANSIRSIPILPGTYAMLMEHKDKQFKYFKANHIPLSLFVFTTDSGKMIDAGNLRRSFMRMLNSADVPYRRFHCIRHTFATEAIRKGVDVKDLQMLLGHSEVETTYIYVQSDMDSKRAAIERMGAMI